MPASAAARATFTSGTAAPTRSSMAVLDLDLAEAAAETDHHALDAAVAHEKIRAEANDGDGNVGRRPLQEISEVGFVGGRIEHLGRAARPEPGEVLERRLGLQPAAQLGQAGDRAGSRDPPVQARPLCCSSFFGKALIQSVMVPAPRPTTTSPDLATEAMVSTKASSSSTVST